MLISVLLQELKHKGVMVMDKDRNTPNSTWLNIGGQDCKNGPDGKTVTAKR